MVEEEHDHTHYHGVDRAEEQIGVDQVLKLLIERIVNKKVETVRSLDANGRILAADVKSTVDVPKRGRSTRDGYAINFFEQSAREGRSFELVGEVRIGTMSKISLKPGQSARVATGSYLPDGTKGVLMVEYSRVNDKTLVVTRELTSGENILEKGADISKGNVVFSKGSRVFPQHVALFSMLGIRRVQVYARPKISVFSTGDELVDASKSTPANSEKKNNSIFDVNRPFLKSMIESLGGIAIDLGIAKDKLDVIRRKIISGLKYDALVLSAGSSVGERDYVSKAAESIKGVEILAHGVAMRPSSPTGIAVYRNKPLLLLPGFPTSAIMSFFVFGVPAILKISGSSVLSLPSIMAKMTEEYHGKPGIRHYVRVKVSRVSSEYQASIVRPSEAQYSSWIQSANGIAIINDGAAKQGDSVEVLMIGEIPSKE
jgi:molybdopterin molybdotransferase